MAGFFQKMKGVRTTTPIQAPVAKSKDQIKAVVTRWQKNRTPQDTKQIVAYLKPTIQSALHTYTPGQESAFRIKATKLALQSLTSYDASKAAAPSSFVFTNLQRLNRIRRQRQNIIHIPESQVYLKQQIDKKVQQLQDDLGRQPTIDQICDATGMSRKKLQKIEGNSTFSESSAINPQTQASTFGVKDITDRDYYNYVYSSVGDVDKKILQWSMPYNGTPLSNNDIAKRLKLSPGAISQRKARLQQMMSEVRGLL